MLTLFKSLLCSSYFDHWIAKNVTNLCVCSYPNIFFYCNIILKIDLFPYHIVNFLEIRNLVCFCLHVPNRLHNTLHPRAHQKYSWNKRTKSSLGIGEIKNESQRKMKPSEWMRSSNAKQISFETLQFQHCVLIEYHKEKEVTSILQASRFEKISSEHTYFFFNSLSDK